MKLWIDDVRMAPDGFIWIKSVNEAKCMISANSMDIELIDIDHDAGEYAKDGGDYIRLFDWLEETGYQFPIHIHSMNPVGIENMRRIIKKNRWNELRYL